jgi:hypothetical protein
MFRAVIVVAASLVLTGCASAPPPAPEPLALNGTLDLSRHRHSCCGHFRNTRLRSTLRRRQASGDTEPAAGLLRRTVRKLRGTVTFIGGQTGEVTFPPPAAPAPAVAPAVVVPAPSVSYSPPPFGRATTYVRHRGGSTGYVYVRSHTRRATYVCPHYRNGRYVSGHYRSGSSVRGHYRRRR